ncbi:hypothetical protein Lal_00000809 [Lupinus albus]|nr:hypothetical protein Lal_00000809 [Lupinus albus]
MVDNLDLNKDQHIDSLYSHRQLWDLAYLKDNFFVGVVVNVRNQAGEEARMRQKYHNPHIITNFPIEEHAATILTPYAFQLLQHEIELSSKYVATKIGNDSYVVEFEFSGILCRHAIQVLLKSDYFCLPKKYLPSRWRRKFINPTI